MLHSQLKLPDTKEPPLNRNGKRSHGIEFSSKRKASGDWANVQVLSVQVAHQASLMRWGRFKLTLGSLLKKQSWHSHWTLKHTRAGTVYRRPVGGRISGQRAGNQIEEDLAREQCLWRTSTTHLHLRMKTDRWPTGNPLLLFGHSHLASSAAFRVSVALTVLWRNFVRTLRTFVCLYGNRFMTPGDFSAVLADFNTIYDIMNVIMI